MENNSIAFSKLKPVCVNFLRDCSIENIDALQNVVKELDSDSVESLQEYIALPVIVHLKRKPSEKITIKCIDFLTLIFKTGRVKNWSFFVDIFILMLSKISNYQDMDQVSSGSEEIKLSVCENMLCLVQSSTEEVLNEMYSLSFRPYLAQAFFVFKILLKDEKSKILLKMVLRTIGGFTYNKEYVGKIYKKTELIASEALASCLPGLSTALQRVVCGDDKQAHSIIIIALSILTNLIILTVGNESYERNMANDIPSDVHHICYESNKQSMDIPFILKNEAWFKSVSENLKILIKNMNIMTHHHWKVRLEFLKCSKLLLFRCTKTLGNCAPVLLPYVFALSIDDNEVVSLFAKDILVSLSEKLQTVDYAILNSIIEDNIENLISQLIKCQFSGNDDKKLITLKSLLGYINVSGLSLNKLLFSMTYLERIIMILVTLLEFNISELNMVEEIPVTENVGINLVWPKKRFKFFEKEEIFDTICKICYSLGQLGNFRLLINYLLEKMSCTNLYTLQCIFIIGNIIKGLSKDPDTVEKYTVLISDILETFLSDSLFDAPTHSNDNIYSQEQLDVPSMELTLSNNVLNKNKLQICLLLEAIANCSECLGTNFKLHLMKILCRVMEKAGSCNFIISECGRICLYHIAQSCKYKSVQELIKDNAHYITNIIMINFHQYVHKPEIAIVLRVAMELSDAEALVLFRDLILQILDFLDYNKAKAYPLLNVLFSVTVCIKKWFPCKKYCQVNNFPLKNTTNESLQTLVTDYIALKESNKNYTQDFTNEGSEKTVNSEPQNCEEDFTQSLSDADCSVDENKPDIPLHISIICEIFKRCVHLQSSQNRFVRMLTLETVEMCIHVLCDYEHQLHPLVHEFWSPFLRRFTEDTFASKAFNVLLAIANECGDFIRSRTLKDIIPKLVLFLQKECSKSLLQCNFKQYQWTNDHALQILVLSEIGNLCAKLDVDDKDINAVAAACLPYIEKKQPKVLQDAAAKSLNVLSTLDSDSIWFYWKVSFCEESILISPHDDLFELSFPYSNNSRTSVNIDL